MSTSSKSYLHLFNLTQIPDPNWNWGHFEGAWDGYYWNIDCLGESRGEPLCAKKCNFERDCNQASQQGPRGWPILMNLLSCLVLVISS